MHRSTRAERSGCSSTSPTPSAGWASWFGSLVLEPPIVVVDIDADMWIVNVEPRAVTRRLLEFASDSFGRGWIGRELPGMMRDLGLVDVELFGDVVCFTDYEAAAGSMQLHTHVEQALRAGVVTKEEVDGWLEGLDAAVRSRHFSASSVIYTAVGRKPGA